MQWHDTMAEFVSSQYVSAAGDWTQYLYRLRVPTHICSIDHAMFLHLTSLTCVDGQLFRKIVTVKEIDRSIDWLIDWLVFNGMSTQKGQFVPTVHGERNPAQAAKDGQQDSMHNTLSYKITM